MTLGLPSVDCLMVTLPVLERFAFAKQSIADYCAQTYPLKRLLIITDPRGSVSSYRTLRDHVASLNRHDIEFVAAEGATSLGQLRNISMIASSAEFICQWDDDDRFHPQRLAAQMNFLQENRAEATYLQEVMQYFPSVGELYWTNWRAAPAGGHPGTLMARRSEKLRYPTEGGTSNLGEDLTLALALKERGEVRYLGDMAHLFVYVSHGKNSWDDGHHKMLSQELSISKGLLKRREGSLRECLACFDFQPGLIICGSNGAAFTL